jgi:putative ABC transport system ATP-binding protein
MNATAELTVIGIGSGDPASQGFLAALRERLEGQHSVAFTPHGNGALLEGELDDIFALAAELHRIPLELGMPQVCTMLKVEQRATAQVQAPANGHRNGTAAVNGFARSVAAVGVHGGRGDSFAHAVAAGLLDTPETFSSPMPPLPPVAAPPQRPAARTQPVYEEPVTAPQPVAPRPAGPPAIRTVGLTKAYGDGDARVEALKGVDLEIGSGEFVAVMGPSGSGKSTLMHILGALETPSGGTVEIGGTSYTGLDDEAQTKLRRDRIGFVFQFFNLIKTLTAEENVMLPSLVAGASQGELRDRARELLELVGLEQRFTHLPSEMSGGEQQRVSVARALMREPQLLLADEPTGNLDTRNSRAVLDLLSSLRTETGQTILMVTHDPVAASRSSRVVFLRDGLLAGEIAGGDPKRIVDYFSTLSRED